jgi:hypothetical protein
MVMAGVAAMVAWRRLAYFLVLPVTLLSQSEPIRYDDLPQYGVVLVPPSSPDFAGMLTDIQRRVANPVAGSPSYPGGAPRVSDIDRAFSAILVNRATKPIANITLVWRSKHGKLSLGLMTGPTVLDAFSLPPTEATWANYWRVILPGSKRYIGARTMVGDNSDVRPPTPAEQGGTNLFPHPEPLLGGDAIDSMSIDGLFFADGTFVGPDTQKMWERTVYCVKAQQALATVARAGHDRGESTAQLMSDVRVVTGPAEQRFPNQQGHQLSQLTSAGDFQDWYLAQTGRSLDRQSHNEGDDAAVAMLLRWSNIKPPNFSRM